MTKVVHSKNTDKLPFGVLEIDNNRKVIYCNEYALNTLSKHQNDIVEQPLELLFTPASKIFSDCYVFPMLLENSEAKEVQLTLRVDDQKNVPVVANVSLEDNGSSIWSFMPCENRNKLYDELLDARDTLSVQANELKAANESLQLKKEDLEIFCRSLSHDFTGPIRRVNQFIQLSIADLKDDNSDSVNAIKWLDMAQSQTDSLEELTKGLISFLTADDSKTEFSTMDLNEVVSVAVSLSVDQKENPVDIQYESLPKIRGDKTQLQLIFKNLIGNAIKYNKNKPKIIITCDSISKEGYEIIKIKDNGIGMSSQYLETIFEPFKRLHGDREYSGSGLGLSIVRKLVDKHKAYIDVESIEGEGSIFLLAFPVATIET